MVNIKNKKGFTIIEVIIVIAILGILTAVSIPNFSGCVKYVKIAADQDVVKNLNSVTHLMRVASSSEDPFKDKTKSNHELLEILVDNGYLTSIVLPQTKDAEFVWHFEEEKWSLSFEESFYIIALDDGFNLNNLGWLMGSYEGNSKDIVIPASINGVAIKAIYQDTFRNKGLTIVDFDSNSQVQRIHARAFLDNKLTNINLPDSVERIDLWSFKDNNLTEIKLPPNLHTIEQRAFDGNNLTKIKIGANVDVIQERAFGINTELFKQAYETGGSGTYIWDGYDWIRQND